jgi:hypothetical protein
MGKELPFTVVRQQEPFNSWAMTFIAAVQAAWSLEAGAGLPCG